MTVALGVAWFALVFVVTFRWQRRKMSERLPVYDTGRTLLTQAARGSGSFGDEGARTMKLRRESFACPKCGSMNTWWAHDADEVERRVRCDERHLLDGICLDCTWQQPDRQKAWLTATGMVASKV
jgi:hypothetical protein